MWKAVNSGSNSLKITIKTKTSEAAITRADKNVTLMEQGLTKLCKKTFLNDAAHLWNSTPISIKDSNSLYSAKKEIKTFVKSLPF